MDLKFQLENYIRLMYPIFLIIIILSSCTSRQARDDQRTVVRKLKSIDTVFLSKTIDNPKEMGFKPQELGPASGVSGLFKDGSYLYLTDGYFGNIKKYNLETSQIDLVSATFDSARRDVGPLLAIGDTLICLTTFQDKVYYLTPNFELLAKKQFSKGSKEFRVASDEIYLSSLREKNKLFSRRLTEVLYRESAEIWAYTISPCGPHQCLQNRFGNFEIRGELLDAQFLEVSNVIFDESTIVYLDDRNQKKYALVIFNY